MILLKVGYIQKNKLMTFYSDFIIEGKDDNYQKKPFDSYHEAINEANGDDDSHEIKKHGRKIEGFIKKCIDLKKMKEHHPRFVSSESESEQTSEGVVAVPSTHDVNATKQFLNLKRKKRKLTSAERKQHYDMKVKANTLGKTILKESKPFTITNFVGGHQYSNITKAHPNFGLTASSKNLFPDVKINTNLKKFKSFSSDKKPSIKMPKKTTSTKKNFFDLEKKYNPVGGVHQHIKNTGVKQPKIVDAIKHDSFIEKEAKYMQSQGDTRPLKIVKRHASIKYHRYNK